ncbi:MAG: hypothetical protein ACJAV1_003613 [Paraglaciecola sp.]|jgi:hypothetical protein
MNNKNKAVAFKAINNILGKWTLTDSEKIDILGFSSKVELDIFTQSINTLQMTQDLEVRISLILNIHAELRQLFSNPLNVYGFMKMVNHNPSFDGKMPLDLACESLEGLSYVFESITRIRHTN